MRHSTIYWILYIEKAEEILKYIKMYSRDEALTKVFLYWLSKTCMYVEQMKERRFIMGGENHINDLNIQDMTLFQDGLSSIIKD